jgi:hypothetical protein
MSAERAIAVVLMAICAGAGGLRAAPSAAARDPADCTGLVPQTLPAPVDLDLAGTDTTACRAWAIDDAGAILVERLDRAQATDELRVYAPDGLLRGTVPSANTSEAWAGSSGFLVRTEGFSPDYKLVHIEAVGISARAELLGRTVLTDGPVPPYSSAWLPDPRGGLVVLEPRLAASGPATARTPWELWLRRISTTGPAAPPIRIDSLAGFPQDAHGGVTADGSIAVLLMGSSVPSFRNNQDVARWFDPAGAPRTPWFLLFDESLDAVSPSFRLPDGSLQVRGVRLAAGSQTPTQPPAWSTVLFVWELPDRIVTLPSVETQDPKGCGWTLAIRAPAGNLCGNVIIPTPPSGPFCGAPPWPLIGRDGTVLQGPIAGCQMHSWPGLLRAP